MTKIYACLVGNWACLDDDPTCTIGEKGSPPFVWWEENAELWAPANRTNEDENSLYNLDYVKIIYKGKGYRINPIFLQIVTE